MTNQYCQRPISGVGIGLRHQHFSDIKKLRPNIAWFEILGDNYFNGGGIPLAHIKEIREHYPMTIHTVGLSLGGSDPLDDQYLQQLAQLADDIQPAWLSDHLCWTSLGQKHFHELMPLPYIDDAISQVVSRLQTVQATLGCPFLLENVSSYIAYKESYMPEWDFITRIVEEAGCGLLLDVNNIFVSSQNQGYDPETYLNAIPKHAVKQIHLAGYHDQGQYLIDTHGERVHPPVWSLYESAIKRFGEVPTLIEWDSDVPALSVLLQEADKATQIMQQQRMIA